ncbi:MAG TPA: hypothetical protein VNF49_10285 [Candidatus Binataceae bacterium]|nr:hypothetical protein [Candidatus Binataceae bacterium]
MKGAVTPWICAGLKALLPLLSVVVVTKCAGKAESSRVTVPFMATVIGAPLAAVAVAVPEIAPLAVLSAIPAGSAGLTEYVVTVPVTFGESGVIVVPTARLSPRTGRRGAQRGTKNSL